MRTGIGNESRDRRRAREAKMSPGERVALALKLGEADVALLASARGISVAEAVRVARRARQVGRVPSKAMLDAGG